MHGHITHRRDIDLAKLMVILYICLYDSRCSLTHPVYCARSIFFEHSATTHWTADTARARLEEAAVAPPLQATAWPTVTPTIFSSTDR